jgi:hypothetical protein
MPSGFPADESKGVTQTHRREIACVGQHPRPRAALHAEPLCGRALALAYMNPASFQILRQVVLLLALVTVAAAVVIYLLMSYQNRSILNKQAR